MSRSNQCRISTTSSQSADHMASALSAPASLNLDHRMSWLPRDLTLPFWNYSTTCHFYCVVITKSHRQTFTVRCLLWWRCGVNLRSGEMSSFSFSQLNTQSCAVVARAGNCLSHCTVVATLLCMLCCRGSGVDMRLSCCHSVLI